MGKVDAIILAGGLGTRLKEVVRDVPKVLLPVNGRPFLDILLHRLQQSGTISKVILAVGYRADRIVEHYRDNTTFHFPILFSVETELLGTGGAIKKALGYAETDNILVLNGDSYVDVNLEELLAFHGARKAAMTLVVKEVDDAGRYGKVIMNADGRVVSFAEKKADFSGGYINAGVYLFMRNLFERVEEGKVISLEKDLLPLFLGESLHGFICRGKFIDIGIPATYKISGDYLKGIMT